MVEQTREWSASLADARATAAEVVQQVDSDLVVAGAKSHHDSTFVELLISDNSCRREPCRVLVSLDRSVTERVFRKTVEAAVRQHIIR